MSEVKIVVSIIEDGILVDDSAAFVAVVRNV